MNDKIVKIPRNMFKCFECRGIFTQRDGNWFGWDSMQVHLCHTCDKKTETREERANFQRTRSNQRAFIRG